MVRTFWGMSTRDRSEIIENIMVCLGKLPVRELRGLELMCLRTVKGLVEYGPLSRKKRVWRKELVEELADAWSYTMFELLDMEDEE